MHSTAEAMHRPLPGVTSSIDELLRNITLIAIVVIVSKYFLSNFFLWLTSRHILIRSPHVLLSIILGIRSSIAYPRLNPPFLFTLSSSSPSLPLHPRLLFTLVFSSPSHPHHNHHHPRLIPASYQSSPLFHPHHHHIPTFFASSLSSPTNYPRIFTILVLNPHRPLLPHLITPITLLPFRTITSKYTEYYTYIRTYLPNI